MERDTIDTIAVIARGALEEQGYGASFGHDTEDGDRAFYVSDLASGLIIAEIIVKDPDSSGHQPGDTAQ